MLSVILYCKERLFSEKKDLALVLMEVHLFVIVNSFQTLSRNLGKKSRKCGCQICGNF